MSAEKTLATLLEEAVRFQTRFMGREDQEIRGVRQLNWQAVEAELLRMIDERIERIADIGKRKRAR